MLSSITWSRLGIRGLQQTPRHGDGQSIVTWLARRSSGASHPRPHSGMSLTVLSFHAVYWPAILMALHLPLPKQILAHGHWTLGHRKMSKSVGNVVNPFFAIHRFDADTIRFYMAYDGGITDDADYDNGFVIRRYKCELQNALGNLTSRITRGKRWNVKEAVQFGRQHNIGSGELHDLWQSTRVEDMPATVDGLMKDLQINRALQHIMAQINEVSLPDICYPVHPSILYIPIHESIVPAMLSH